MRVNFRHARGESLAGPISCGIAQIEALAAAHRVSPDCIKVNPWGARYMSSVFIDVPLALAKRMEHFKTSQTCEVLLTGEKPLQSFIKLYVDEDNYLVDYKIDADAVLDWWESTGFRLDYRFDKPKLDTQAIMIGLYIIVLLLIAHEILSHWR